MEIKAKINKWDLQYSSSAQSCQTFCDSMDCGLPVSFVRGISQARTLEWVAISFSRGYSLHFNYETALLKLLKMHMEGSMAEVVFLSYSFQNSINYVLIVPAQ